MMKREDVILVTGSDGMVGHALVHHLRGNFTHVVALTRKDCDLEDREATRKCFQSHQPKFVFHLAAKVGGIKANISDPVGFLQANALISCHVLEAAYKVGAHKTLVLGSSCIYPRECPQPMREEYIMTGPLEPTNEGYALGKILGLRLAQYYHQQHGMNVVCPVPSNIYGPGDTYDLERSHVLSALVRRFVDAREEGRNSVTLWGSGKARREFVHVEDVVRGMLFCMQQLNTPEIHNLGPGTDCSVAELAEKIKALTGYKGRIDWDTSKADGMPRKCMDVSRLKALGFTTQVSLENGIREVVKEYETIYTREHK
ncbi:MAG: GDP-L-fucose synthase [Bdellovibrionales bacterium]|nr:GDP-L-fucose synthase [Bdellovibrionales bacterium]